MDEIKKLKLGDFVTVVTPATHIWVGIFLKLLTNNFVFLFVILDVNENCNNLLSAIRGSPPPTTVCKEGLICNDGKCRDFKTLINS